MLNLSNKKTFLNFSIIICFFDSFILSSLSNEYFIELINNISGIDPTQVASNSFISASESSSFNLNGICNNEESVTKKSECNNRKTGNHYIQCNFCQENSMKINFKGNLSRIVEEKKNSVPKTGAKRKYEEDKLYILTNEKIVTRKTGLDTSGIISKTYIELVSIMATFRGFQTINYSAYGNEIYGLNDLYSLLQKFYDLSRSFILDFPILFSLLHIFLKNEQELIGIYKKKDENKYDEYDLEDLLKEIILILAEYTENREHLQFKRDENIDLRKSPYKKLIINHWKIEVLLFMFCFILPEKYTTNRGGIWILSLRFFKYIAKYELLRKYDFNNYLENLQNENIVYDISVVLRPESQVKELERKIFYLTTMTSNKYFFASFFALNENSCFKIPKNQNETMIEHKKMGIILANMKRNYRTALCIMLKTKSFCDIIPQNSLNFIFNNAIVQCQNKKLCIQ